MKDKDIIPLKLNPYPGWRRLGKNETVRMTDYTNRNRNKQNLPPSDVEYSLWRMAGFGGMKVSELPYLYIIRKTKQNMTKIEALKICTRMWGYLAENPTKNKIDAIKTLNLPQCMLNRCACCEYVAEKMKTPYLGCAHVDSERYNQEHLSLCPLKSLWPRGCMHFDSPYYLWSKPTPILKINRTHYAMIIYKVAYRLVLEEEKA